MDVNTFYDLRIRLYAAAAAGCGLITEDFRLKRALEAFKPMAEANKVFGRLYQMCGKLFESDHVANELTDCIALADALAVTQGSFMEQSECADIEKDKLDLKPQIVSYKIIQELKEVLSSGKKNNYYFTQENMQRVLEPRIFPAFIQGLKRKEEFLEDMADILLPQLKDGVRSLLKEQIDFEDTSAQNKTSYYVGLICKLYGYQENDWYLSLIEEESYPNSIRVKAVHALKCSEKNIPKLLELYRTQKGAVKKAVTLVLAEMNPPEAEEIWEKMAEKYKSSYEEVVIWSNSDIWAEFVKEYFEEFIQWCEGKDTNVVSTYQKLEVNLDMFWLIQVVHRKHQLEECFFLFAEKYAYIKRRYTSGIRDWRKEMNQVLIENLLEEDVRYSEMIKNLYREHKEFYFPARFFLALKEDGEHAFEKYHEEIRHKDNRESVLYMLGTVKYNYILEGYYLPWDCLHKQNSGVCQTIRVKEYQKLKLFDIIPDNVISYVTETDYFSSQNEAKKDKELDDTIRCALSVFDPKRLGLKLGSKEYEKYKEVAVEFAFKVNQNYSTYWGAEIEKIILPYYKNGTAEEYINMFINHCMQNLHRGQVSDRAVYEVNYLPISDEEKKSGLIQLKEAIEKVNGADKKTKKKMLSEIDTMLKRKNMV